jgi:hypothetical protein
VPTGIEREAEEDAWLNDGVRREWKGCSEGWKREMMPEEEAKYDC